ncbi:TPA: hypothetical protein HNO24_25525 [Escherichia coli]|nr:hypothetical protein [Escherichia coli]HAJ7160332.1 hypothetical protein [Escherichia coli]HAJ7165386.1 hypothetical protein [Escherichia coli]HAJ7170598.1 hypothetical protein [Escherichia coli]HAJ7199943.1 hypothetical protein [Escherichia coli]
MTLNTSQVSYYMTQRKKGIPQCISAMKEGSSVRSGRRLEKGSEQKKAFIDRNLNPKKIKKHPKKDVYSTLLRAMSAPPSIK